MKLEKAFLAQKCPKCRQGDMFVGKTYSFKFGEAHKNCQHCGLRFEVEPGFFTGAMYFSYAINVFIIAIVGVSANVLTNWNVYIVMSVVLGVVFICVPYTFRYSRMLMMYMFSGVNYDENLDKD
jgi:uncharacterized protein (DUF983 family)